MKTLAKILTIIIFILAISDLSFAGCVFPETVITTKDSSSSYATTAKNVFAPNYKGQCTWYTYGRVIELTESGYLKFGTDIWFYNTFKEPGGRDAKNWPDLLDVTTGGIDSGYWFPSPLPMEMRKPGLIAVWIGGMNGHVGFVEEVSEDKTRYRLSDFNRGNDEIYRNQWYNFEGTDGYLIGGYPYFRELECNEIEKLPTPILTSPSKGANDQPTDITLRWEAVSGATRYRIFISDDYNCLDSVNDTGTDCDCCIQPSQVTTNSYHNISGLESGKRYYWMVRAGNDTQGSENSQIFWFDTENNSPLPTPVLTSPSNGANDQPTDITLRWETVSGATRYRIFISDDYNCLDSVNDTGTDCDCCIQPSQVTTNSYHNISGLESGKRYYWMVRAGNDTQGSENSQIFWFDTENNSPLPTPVLTSPSNGANDQPTDITLRWETVSGATRYRIFISDDYNCLDSVNDTGTDCDCCIQPSQVTTNSYHNISGLENGKRYYWMIRAGNDTQGSENSQIFWFDTEKLDLKPFKGSNWDDYIVVSTQPGTSNSSLTIYDDEKIYVDCGCEIIGGGQILAQEFFYFLRINGQNEKYWEVGESDDFYSLDEPIGPLSAGNHTISIECDSAHDINESNEDNNFFELDITITPRPIPYINVPESVSVPEGGKSNFAVTLSSCPSENVTLNIARTSGDSDISISSDARLVFTPSDWGEKQYVTLEATEDEDTENGTSTFSVSATGLTSKEITVNEQDNDTPLATEEKLLSDDGLANDEFGSAVSIAGSYAIVGSALHNEKGAAYVFKYDNGTWRQQNKLTASDGNPSDHFGASVAVEESGNYAVISAYENDGKAKNAGAAYIFKRTGESWIQHSKLVAEDGAQESRLGYFNVGISGDYTIVGASNNSAYVFKYNRNTDNWNQYSKLTPEDGKVNRFGVTVSIYGNYAIVGAHQDSDKGNYAGAAYIFEKDSTGWKQKQKIFASDAKAEDHFGISVSIFMNYAIIGAEGVDDNGSISGAAYVFERVNDVWIQKGKLRASDGQPYDHLGWSVSISNKYAVVGAYGDDINNINRTGSVYLYKMPSGGWSDMAETELLVAKDGQDQDYLGYSVSVSGDYFISGAYQDDDKGINAGSAYIFKIGETSPPPSGDGVVLALQDTRTVPGTLEVPVSVSLDNFTYNNSPISSVQFTVQYDSNHGIHAKNDCNLISTRTEGYSKAIVVTENGSESSVKVLLYDIQGRTIAPGIGPVLNLLFDVDSDALENDTSLRLTECVLADANANRIPCDFNDAAIFSIVSPEPEGGDINGDGDINVLDIQRFLICFLGTGSCENCDLNSDSDYNVIDLQIIISKVLDALSNGKTSRMRISRASDATNLLTIPSMRLAQDSAGTFSMSLSNENTVSSAQIRLTYDSTIGFDITDVNLTSRTQNYSPPEFIKDSTNPRAVEISILLFSQTGAVLSPGIGDILEFSYQTEPDGAGETIIAFTETIISNQNAESVEVVTKNGDASYNKVFLSDVITILQICSGMTPNLPAGLNLNQDEKVGLEDAIHILQALSGIND